MNNLNHTCYTLSRNSNRCDVCGARLSLINDAPTVERIVCRSRNWSNECTHSSSFEQGYVQGYEEGKNDRPKGKWIDTGRTWEETVDGFIQYGKIYKCSACKAEAKGLGECTSFCGYCGTKMER